MKFIINLPVRPEVLKLLEPHKVYIANDSDPENFIDELSDSEAFIIRIPLKKFSAELISRCKKLRVIGRIGTGYDMIDINKASSLGIPVVIAPGANALSVAEHAVSMIFALSKNLLASHDGVLNNNWNVRDSGRAFELSGKTAGIIGTGSIGSKTAELCKALGMNIISCNSRSTRGEFENLLRNSDIISLHVPINDKTINMISENEIALMKSSAILINTARSELVNKSALVRALNSGLISGAGIDVFDREPPNSDDELLKCPNVIFSPHSASITKEASFRTAEMCIKGCLAVLNGERWPYVADKSVYDNWYISAKNAGV